MSNSFDEIQNGPQDMIEHGNKQPSSAKVTTKLTKMGSDFGIIIDEEMLEALSFPPLTSEFVEIETDGKAIFIKPINQPTNKDEGESQ